MIVSVLPNVGTLASIDCKNRNSLDRPARVTSMLHSSSGEFGSSSTAFLLVQKSNLQELDGVPWLGASLERLRQGWKDQDKTRRGCATDAV